MLHESSFTSASDYLMNLSLTDWQKSQLKGISVEGVYCLLAQWAHFNETSMHDELYCNATWDERACWPATMAGTTVILPCSEVMKNESRFDPENLSGDARRTCLENGAWSWPSSDLSNYRECDESAEDILRKLRRQTTPARYIVRYILYYGSIASVLCLSGSLCIFFYFKSIRCERIKILMNMMLALLLKSLLMIIMVHHTVFKKSFNYKDVDWVCKLVITLQIYGTVASINWMFVQGHYLNSRLTKIVVKKFPMRYYVFIGWGIPLGIVGVWTLSTEVVYGTKCWKDYTKMRTIWILVASLSVVLLLNLYLLINILRVVISSVRNVNNNMVVSFRKGVRNKIRRGTKATAILFPLLGIANLCFFYNPGGNGQKYYMVAQASIHSFQGIVTSILYCFICKDVRDAMRREYYKFQVTHGTSRINNRGNRYTVSFSVRDGSKLQIQSDHTRDSCEIHEMITLDVDGDSKSPELFAPLSIT